MYLVIITEYSLETFRVKIDEFPAISLGFCLMNPGWLKGFSTLDTRFQDGKALNALGLCLKPIWILLLNQAGGLYFQSI